jgi:hypothetical protein
MKTPLEIFKAQGLLSQPEGFEAEAQAAVAALPRRLPRKPLSELRTPDWMTDDTELIRKRFLYKGGMLLLCGPTGIGKSSFLMQLIMHLAVGKMLFGITPGRLYENGMRVLLVQAENDDGDLAEMRDGVLAGCSEFSEAEQMEACSRIEVVTLTDKTREAFATELGMLIAEKPVDLVVVDPAFAYLGGDSNSQKDVSHFMRELLNPLVKERNVGLILVHHTNKPPVGKEKSAWAGNDFAYVGAGSAEWINPCRAALAIRSLGSSDVFELMASKRGKRLGWKDVTGKLTDKQYIAHHGGDGVICWREATAQEIAEVEGGVEGRGRPVCVDTIEFVHCVMRMPGQNRQAYLEEFCRVTGKSVDSAKRRLKECVEGGYLREAGDSNFRRFQVTEIGTSEALKQPPKYDWVQKVQNRVQK